MFWIGRSSSLEILPDATFAEQEGEQKHGLGEEQP
jgi:hypothetical protein